MYGSSTPDMSYDTHDSRFVVCVLIRRAWANLHISFIWRRQLATGRYDRVGGARYGSTTGG